MSKKIVDLAGKQFGRLTALEQCGRRNRSVLWRCKCSCGKEHATTSHHLVSGRVSSCGCLRREMFKQKMHAGRDRANSTRKGVRVDSSRSSEGSKKQQRSIAFEDAIRDVFTNPLELLARAARAALEEDVA